LAAKADFRSFPSPGRGPDKDIHAYRICPKNDAVWNYAFALDSDQPERSLPLKRLSVPSGSRPWDSNPPLGLEVKACRILNWNMAGTQNIR
jgi:hypothetical protein